MKRDLKVKKRFPLFYISIQFFSNQFFSTFLSLVESSFPPFCGQVQVLLAFFLTTSRKVYESLTILCTCTALCIFLESTAFLIYRSKPESWLSLLFLIVHMGLIENWAVSGPTGYLAYNLRELHYNKRTSSYSSVHIAIRLSLQSNGLTIIKVQKSSAIVQIVLFCFLFCVIYGVNEHKKGHK
jgi:hypothetical protein